VMTLRAHYSNY